MRRAMKTVCLAVAALILTAGLAVAAAPDTPSSPSPADGAPDVGMLPNLQWTGGNTDTYFVYLNSSGGGTWFKKTANDSWKIPIGQALPPDTDFTWLVKARNADGDTVGPSWSFTTGSYPYTTSTDAGVDWPLLQQHFPLRFTHPHPRGRQHKLQLGRGLSSPLYPDG